MFARVSIGSLQGWHMLHSTAAPACYKISFDIPVSHSLCLEKGSIHDVWQAGTIERRPKMLERGILRDYQHQGTWPACGMSLRNVSILPHWRRRFFVFSRKKCGFSKNDTINRISSHAPGHHTWASAGPVPDWADSKCTKTEKVGCSCHSQCQSC